MVSGPAAPSFAESGARANDESEKPERIGPATWAAIIVGAGTVLLLLWAVVFSGGSAPQQQQAVKWTPPDDAVVWTPEVGKSLGIPPPPGWQDKTSPATAPADEWSRFPDAATAFGWQDKTTPATAQAAEPKSVPATGNVKILELADLAELVGPSVVQVNVTGPEGRVTGSGFVLDKQGTIVTNFHVIEDATGGRIVFSDKTSAPITGYLGVWPEKDIALVRVECPPDKLHPLRLATSAPRQGERVAAFGSPLGLQQSVSEGIVSAVRESVELRTLGPINVNARLIQTTTPISHGNSGGPLVDMKGLVVGVNTMTFRPLGGENVNFAVAAVELPPLLLAKNETPSPLPASDPAADGVWRILRRAKGHFDAGDYDSALADFTEAIGLDPKIAFAYSGRGSAYMRKGDYDKAIADGTQAIRLDPKYADAYRWRGSAYSLKLDYDRAISDFTEAIRLDPKNALAYYKRGLTYSLKRDYDSAIADLTDAIRLDPKDSDAYYKRGLTYSGKRDYDSSIADFTEAIGLDPKNAQAFYERGLAYQAKGQRAAAERDSAQAKRLGYKAPTTRVPPVPPKRKPVVGNNKVTEAPPAPSAIESRISGEFEGWDGETIVKLTNGQIWKQTTFHYEYHYAYMPEVIIYRTGNVYKMKVEGTSQAVQVTRLK